MLTLSPAGIQSAGAALASGATSSFVIAPWQNTGKPVDVNGDGAVTPIDALVVINYLNAHGQGALPSAFAGSNYLDVNGDNQVTPLDALSVINYLNANVTPQAVGGVAVESPLAGAAASTGQLPRRQLPRRVSMGVWRWGSRSVRTFNLRFWRASVPSSISPPSLLAGPASGSAAAGGYLDQAAANSVQSAGIRRQADGAAEAAAAAALFSIRRSNGERRDDVVSHERQAVFEWHKIGLEEPSPVGRLVASTPGQPAITSRLKRT